MPLHGAFNAIDADCVGLTPTLLWGMNREWLSVHAHNGTPLFVTLQPEAIGPEQDAALREAFALAAKPLAIAEPFDWLTNTTPNEWRCQNNVRRLR